MDGSMRHASLLILSGSLYRTNSWLNYPSSLAISSMVWQKQLISFLLSGITSRLIMLIRQKSFLALWCTSVTMRFLVPFTRLSVGITSKELSLPHLFISSSIRLLLTLCLRRPDSYLKRSFWSKPMPILIRLKYSLMTLQARLAWKYSFILTLIRKIKCNLSLTLRP